MSLESRKLRKKLIRQEKDLIDYADLNVALIGENMMLSYENKKLKAKMENFQRNLLKNRKESL